MIRGRAVAAAAVLWIAAGGVGATSPARAQDPPKAAADDGRAEASLVAAQKLMAEARWKDARTALQAILTENPGSPAVLVRLDEIEELLKRATFKAQWKPTPLHVLIGGGCTKVSAGNVAEFDTQPETADMGWSVYEQTAVFDRPFDSEVSLQFAWGSFHTTAYSPPEVLLAYDPEKRTGYVLGIKVEAGIESNRATGQIERLDESARTEIGKDPTIAFDKSKPGGLEELTFERTPASVVIRIGKRDLAKANDTKCRSGRVALFGRGAGLPKRVKVKGKLAESYVRRITAEAENEDLRVWEAASWSRATVIPRWIQDVEAAAATLAGHLPGSVDAAAFAEVRARLSRWYAGDRMALDSVSSSLRGAPAPVASYVSALAAISWGRLDDAEEMLRTTLAAEPTFGPAHLGLARIALDRGDLKLAEERIDRLRRDIPSFGPVYVVAARLAMAKGDLPAARRALDEAAANGAATQSMGVLRRMLLRMEKGPLWTRRYEVQSAHFDVATDHSQGVCGEVSKLLEDAFASYEAKFRPAPPGPRAKVFVFSGQQSYLDYASDVGTDLSNTLGVYMPATRQLAVFLHDDRAEVWNTIRHEGFHQYLHRFGADVPIWFNEGYAEYFGFSRRVAGKTVTGQANDSQRGAVAVFAPHFAPLRDLFVMDGERFMGRAAVHYVQSWTVIHFFRETRNPAMNAVIVRYFDALVAGKGAKGAFDEVIAPRFDEVERSWRSHLQELSR